MLKERALLAQLTIHQWTNTSFDKRVTAKAEADHQAKNAGRFNKLLVPKEALEGIRKQAAAARETHYALTMPWGDNGDRLLPSKAYMDYTTKLRKISSDFEQAVQEFLSVYPQLALDAQKRLGLMYDPRDYPSVNELREKFGLDTKFFPVPDAADFRVDLDAQHTQQLRDEIVKNIAARQQAALKDCWARLHDVVSPIHERLSKEDAIFRDSLIGNAKFLIDLLPKLNITEDPELEALRLEVQDKLLKPPQRLRDDLMLRKDTADAAAEILARIKAVSV